MLSLRPTHTLALCILLRALLAYWISPSSVSSTAGFLSSSSPLTSWLNLQEGIYLFKRGIDPYSGGVFRHSPLYLSLSSLLPISIFSNPLFCAILFTVADAFAAYALIGIWRLRQGLRLTMESSRDSLLVAIYMLNPCIFIPSLARSTSSLDNACLLGAVMWACEACGSGPGGKSENESVVSSKRSRSKSRSLLLLALRTHLSTDTLILLPPTMMLILSQDPGSRLASPRGFVPGTKNKSTLTTPILVLLAEWFLYWTLLTLLSSLVVGFGSGWMGQTWGASFTLPDLTPNPGVWWYFFTEMFDHFRPFFLMVFSVHLLLYVAPVCIKFQHDPLYAFFILTGILSTFKPYPTLSDPGLFMALWGVFPEVYKYLRHPLVTFLTSLHALLLQPLFAHLWLSHGTGNANFYYATTLVGACSGGLALVDACWAGLRIAVGGVEGVDERGEEKEVVTQQ
ncbi:PIG-U-domain-containing protein [Gymnopus androsaceus JB14]|uniref:PIG-U-domain-containing protein n=1 Tax=Gymnopus androsaceus JB14 TaxID=1447944 RepID=A0A6A4HZQ1_9AGAR|nr:PIG-U-domain-containing protein [Gymnopus androsaceus JB14]